MRPVFSCRSCGFVSTLGHEFTRFQGVRVCKDCKEDYGRDADVTRWIDQAVASARKVAAEKFAERSTI